MFLACRRDSLLELGDTPVLHEDFTKTRKKAPRIFFSGQKYKNNDTFFHQAKCLSATAGLKPDFKAMGIGKSPFPTCMSVGPLGLQLKADRCTSQD